MEIPLPRRGDRAVCKKCGTVMDDGEPMSARAEFYHKPTHRDGTKSKCPNASKMFFWDMQTNKIDPEIEPFMRKRTRRAVKRTAARAPR